MTERIILSIVAILMLILTVQRNKKWPIILTCGLTIGILITWTGIPLVITLGMMIYMISALSITIYGLKKKELPIYEKIIISLSGIFSFISNLFALMHYPYAYEMGLSMIIPLILYLVVIGKGMTKKSEFGFMTILNVQFLMRFINIWR
jgi:hypothetical protein